MAPRATADVGGARRHVRVALFVAAALSCACSRFPGTRSEAMGVRIGAHDPTLGESHIGRGRAPDAPALSLLDSHESGLFNLGAAEIVDFHPASRQVFVVNSKAARVTVLTLGARGFERGEKALEPRRDIAGFSAGHVTSLAVSGNLVAVAVCASANDRRGRVAFYAADELRFLGAVTVGYVPDMLTFTPDGKTLLVANEGEQIRNADERILSDPEGSVSLVDLTLGAERAFVVDATFEAFDARVEEYRGKGVRVPRLGDSFFEAGEGEVKLSRDLEPEYIAVASDGKTAWVSLQENDAVAVLDVAARAFVEILPLGVKDFSVGLPNTERLPLPAPPAVSSDQPLGARSQPGTELIRVASFTPEPNAPVFAEPTGLWFDARQNAPDGKLFYIVRGAAIERLVLGGGGLRQAGRAVELEAHARGGFRGLVRDGRTEGFWLGAAGEEVVYNVSAEGRVLSTLQLGQTRQGRAMAASIAALALDAERQRLFVLLEARPTVGGVSVAPSRLVRVLVLDVNPQSARFGEALGEHLYTSDAASRSTAGYRVMAAAYSEGDRLLVLEQEEALPASRSARALRLFRADLTGASDVLGVSTGAGKTLEACTIDELASSYALEVMHKQRLLSLPGVPLAPGVGLLDDGSIAILEQVSPPAPTAGAEPDGAAIELIRFDDNNRFDASDRDGKVELRHWPVLGAYMPDGVEALRVAGRDYFVTANEGDTRHYDAKRLADVELDPHRFPAAAALQSSATLGRLKISAFDGDLDGDGDLDEVQAFGARSVSVWDSGGNLVADTGSLFEEVTALGLASAFNSNNLDNGTFDTRSDDKGPEPEGLEVAEIDGRFYAFVGLERVGGIVVLDVTDPRGVVFVEYVNPRDFSGSAARGSARDLGPEGLRFVPASESPTGRGVLLVGNEVSGSTSVYDVNL